MIPLSRTGPVSKVLMKYIVHSKETQLHKPEMKAQNNL